VTARCQLGTLTQRFEHAAFVDDKEDFIYDAKTNEYRCPAGERLIWRFSTVERGLKLSKYWSSNCQLDSVKQRGRFTDNHLGRSTGMIVGGYPVMVVAPCW
jgi:hypothetical protein